jgi:hypothetical protein
MGEGDVMRKGSGEPSPSASRLELVSTLTQSFEPSKIHSSPEPNQTLNVFLDELSGLGGIEGASC